MTQDWLLISAYLFGGQYNTQMPELGSPNKSAEAGHVVTQEWVVLSAYRLDTTLQERYRHI